MFCDPVGFESIVDTPTKGQKRPKVSSWELSPIMTPPNSESDLKHQEIMDFLTKEPEYTPTEAIRLLRSESSESGFKHKKFRSPTIESEGLFMEIIHSLRNISIDWNYFKEKINFLRNVSMDWNYGIVIYVIIYTLIICLICHFASTEASKTISPLPSEISEIEV